MSFITLVFDEKFKYKQSKRKEQLAENKLACKDLTAAFDIIVKASNPKKKISTIVKFRSLRVY